jgi:hypothetical protein
MTGIQLYLIGIFAMRLYRIAYTTGPTTFPPKYVQNTIMTAGNEIEIITDTPL